MHLEGMDSGLLRIIEAIEAIDDHAHPLPLGVEGTGDPKHPINLYDYELPKRMRQDNPEYLDAWAALWGYEHRDFHVAHLAELMERKSTIMAEKGDGYNSWVLDRINIDRMVNINSDMHDSLPTTRFPWCAHVEWMLWPLACEPMPGGPSKLLSDTMTRKRSALGLESVPPTLDGYMDEVVYEGLKQIKDTGGVGIKFNTPYYRDLAFGKHEKSDVSALYLRGVRDGSLPPQEHKVVQDYVFRALVIEAGRLDLGVQMHTGYGVRRQFGISGSNPLLMESVFREAEGTRFMMLHGGWPFVTETVALMGFTNVYNDFSCADIYQYPRSLAHQIRQALEWFPEKLMYGTDAYSDRVFGMLSGTPPKANPLHGWEEKAWIIDRTGRQALGLALSGMLSDRIITANEAETYIQMVMRDTVSNFHRLDGSSS